MLRLRALVVALVTLAVLAPSSANAAGTGGIEVTPLASGADGRAATAFHVTLPRSGSEAVEFALRNVAGEPRTARVYAASATRHGDDYDVGGAGSSPYVSLADTEVELAADEARKVAFRVGRGRAEMPAGEAYAAIVVEVRQGAVVQRAATLVYLQPGSGLPMPGVGVLALVLVVVLGAGFISARSFELARRSGAPV